MQSIPRPAVWQATPRALAFLVAVAALACGDAPPPLPGLSVCFSRTTPTLPSPLTACSGAAPVADYPELSASCGPVATRDRHLVVTTTDFSTGAVSVATTGNRSVTADVGLGSTDAIPFYRDGLLYLVHRYQIDFVDVQDPCNGFASLGQFPLDVDGVTSVNPNGLAFRSDGLGFVTLFGVPRLAVVDFSRPYTEAVVDYVDMSDFADADGNPEASLAFSCGDTLFVNARRLDPAFVPADREILVAVDGRACRPYRRSIELLGRFAKKVRPDPADASGRSVLLLTTGIERVDLARGKSEWLISDDLLASIGIEGLQLQAFDTTDDGTTAYLAAYTSDYSEVRIWRTGLVGEPSLEPIAGGLNSVESTLEIVGNELWFGDTTPGNSGMRVFDLGQDPPQQIAGPLATGLPPYSAIAVP